MQLGTRTIKKKRSLLWPVLIVLIGVAVLCRWNLPAGEPEIDFVDEEFDGDFAFLGDVIQSTGNALMGAAGDWKVYDLGVVKLARWNPKEWVEEEAGAESLHAVALPFSDGWRELSRSKD